VHTESSWQGGQEYATAYQYDRLYQPIYAILTVPGVMGPGSLAGDWRVWKGYNEAGQLIQQNTSLVPHAPSQATNTVELDLQFNVYTPFGQPNHSYRTNFGGTVLSNYVVGSMYEDLGRIAAQRSSRTNNPAVEAVWWEQHAYDSGTRFESVTATGWDTTPAIIGDGVSWFDHPYVIRDTVGRVTSVEEYTANMKECFVYDQWNRLVRAHSGSMSTACVTSASAASVGSAAAGTDPYDESYAFDDLNRMTSRTDMLANVTSTYNYPAGKHGVTSVVTGASTASFQYDGGGSMTRRNGNGAAGSGTVLAWDRQNRLVAHGPDSYVYTTSNQRLIRQQQGSVKTLYVWGMEVAANGVLRSVTIHRSLGGKVTAVETGVTGTGSSGIYWNCGQVQGSTRCQAPSASSLNPPVPSRKRYRPYGVQRDTSAMTSTDHRFLGLPADASGLSYLNNRYYDPALANFISVDPLVAKTGQPYLYADGNPTTFSDPTGLEKGANGEEYSCRARNTCGGNASANEREGRRGLTFTYMEEKALECIFSSSCKGKELVDAITQAPAALRQGIVDVIDIAQYGDASLADGNWSSQDVEAAASLQSLLDIGLDPGVASLVSSVASRLLGYNDDWEALDAKEQNWFQRNRSTILTVASIVVAVGAVIATGGALAAGAGTWLGATASAWQTASTTLVYTGLALDAASVTDTCVLGNGDCATAATIGLLNVATLGLASGVSRITRGALTSGARGSQAAELALRANRLSGVAGLGASGYLVGLQITTAVEGKLP
jgi:RHS repeat-associated protein